jgi:hypothetical protein
MKTIIAAFLFFILPCLVNAQLKKGKWMIGGVANFSHGSSDDGNTYYKHDSKTTEFRIMPGVGYFFADKFCGGFRINISGLKTKEHAESILPAYSYISSIENTISGFGFSPFIRYYFLPASRKVNLFVDGSYIFNSETRKTKNYQKTIISGGPPSESESSGKNTYDGSYYSIAAGPSIFIGRNVSFELTIGVTAGQTKEHEQTTTKIMFGTGFQVYLGK